MIGPLETVDKPDLEKKDKQMSPNILPSPPTPLSLLLPTNLPETCIVIESNTIMSRQILEFIV